MASHKRKIINYNATASNDTPSHEKWCNQYNSYYRFLITNENKVGKVETFIDYPTTLTLYSEEGEKMLYKLQLFGQHYITSI